jgi:hypothetical protein
VTLEPDYVEFTSDDLSTVVARMAALSQVLDGWINFQPAVDVDDLPPPRTGLGGLLSGRGPDVPLATWTPGASRRRRGADAEPVLVEPPSVGLQHGSGPAAVVRLQAADHPVPDGWVVMQDHAKRGLVVAVPPAVPHEDVLAWLLRAAAILSTVPLDRDWRAAVYAR